MLIRFTKLKDNKVIYSEVDNDNIVNDCFQPCTQPVKKRVCKFIESDKCKQLTLPFKDYKVRLEKYSLQERQTDEPAPPTR